MKALTSSASLTPRCLSTPEDTSTALAPVALIAPATLSGVRPPASNHSVGASHPSRMDQSKALPCPPVRLAPSGGLASISNRSAARKRSAATRSSRDEMPTAFQTSTDEGRLERRLATKSGVSCPCSWKTSGMTAPFRPRRIAGSGSESRTTERIPCCADAIKRSVRRSKRARPSPRTLRGLSGTSTKPTQSAPASAATLTMSVSEIPQILTFAMPKLVAAWQAGVKSRSSVGCPDFQRRRLVVGFAFACQRLQLADIVIGRGLED